MTEEFFIEIKCRSDQADPVADLVVFLNRIAPYMVDNVEVQYGFILQDGERETIVLAKD